MDKTLYKVVHSLIALPRPKDQATHTIIIAVTAKLQLCTVLKLLYHMYLLCKYT